ncbi:hypothetical protein ACWAU3_11375 [Shewanella sp. JL219SE-S6]
MTEPAKPKALQSYLYFSQPSPKQLTPAPEALEEEAITQTKEAIEVKKADSSNRSEPQKTEQKLHKTGFKTRKSKASPRLGLKALNLLVESLKTQKMQPYQPPSEQMTLDHSRQSKLSWTSVQAH